MRRWDRHVWKDKGRHADEPALHLWNTWMVITTTVACSDRPIKPITRHLHSGWQGQAWQRKTAWVHQLTIHLHSWANALAKPAGLTNLLHADGIPPNGTAIAKTALVLPAHLNRPSEEALAGLTADDSIVPPECTCCWSHVVTHHAHTAISRSCLLATGRGGRILSSSSSSISA